MFDFGRTVCSVQDQGITIKVSKNGKGIASAMPFVHRFGISTLSILEKNSDVCVPTNARVPELLRTSFAGWDRYQKRRIVFFSRCHAFCLSDHAHLRGKRNKFAGENGAYFTKEKIGEFTEIFIENLLTFSEKRV